MPKCSVISCPNNSRHVRKKDGVSYFSFPRNPIRCSEWTVIIGKARNELYYKPYKGSVVCSNHFPASDIYKTTKGFNRLNRNAIPILHLSKEQIRSNDNSGSIHVKPDPDDNEQTIVKIENSIGISFDLSKKQIRSNSGSTRVKPDPDDNQQTIVKNENSIRLSVDEDSDCAREIKLSPSTSMSIGSILDTPREIFMKNKLNKCENLIIKKNRRINNLQKQNKRLIKKNTTLKNALRVLMSRKGS